MVWDYLLSTRLTDRHTDQTGLEELRHESAQSQTHPQKPLWRTEPNQFRGTEHSNPREK